MVTTNAPWLGYVLIGGGVLLVLALGGLITLCVMYLKLKKRIDRFMGSKSQRHNLEAMLTSCLESVSEVDSKYASVVSDLQSMRERLRFCVQKVGCVRYNPFNDMGGDLSFTLALLDENDNGVVLNTMHSRDVSYTYCKAIQQRHSNYTLSEEEEEAIALAIGEESNLKAVR